MELVHAVVQTASFILFVVLQRMVKLFTQKTVKSVLLFLTAPIANAAIAENNSAIECHHVVALFHSELNGSIYEKKKNPIRNS